MRSIKPSICHGFPRKNVLLLFSILALLCAMISVCWSAEKSNLYAVAVGVGELQHPNPRTPSLAFAKKDAEDFYRLAKDCTEHFKNVDARLLVNKDATRDNILKAVREVLEQAGPDDVALLFLSGHGAVDREMRERYFFVTYDTQVNDLGYVGSGGLLMSGQELLGNIRSKKVFLVTDACHSGAINLAIDDATIPKSGRTGDQDLVAKSASQFFKSFNNMRGRVAIASSSPEEISFENTKKFDNSIFTHFLLEGVNGAADRSPKDGVIKVKELYDYVYEKTRAETKDRQNPQLYCSAGACHEIPAFPARPPLKIKAQFYYEGRDKKWRPLTDNATLESGQRVGVAIVSREPCYVQIFNFDSNGKPVTLFPNDKLSDGDGKIEAGKEYWFPYREGKDGKAGYKHAWPLARTRTDIEEAIYMLASRKECKAANKQQSELQKIAIRRDFENNPHSIQHFEPEQTVPVQAFEERQNVFDAMQREVEKFAADIRYKLVFRHVPQR